MTRLDLKTLKLFDAITTHSDYYEKFLTGSPYSQLMGGFYGFATLRYDRVVEQTILLRDLDE